MKSDDNTNHCQDNLMFLLGSIWHCAHFVPLVSGHAKVANLDTLHVYATAVLCPSEVPHLFSLWCLYRAYSIAIVGENVECRLESLTGLEREV